MLTSYSVCHVVLWIHSILKIFNLYLVYNKNLKLFICTLLLVWSKNLTVNSRLQFSFSARVVSPKEVKVVYVLIIKKKNQIKFIHPITLVQICPTTSCPKNSFTHFSINSINQTHHNIIHTERQREREVILSNTHFIHTFHEMTVILHIIELST